MQFILLYIISIIISFVRFCWYEYHVVSLRGEIGDRGLAFTNSAMDNSAIECLSKCISKRLSTFGLDLLIAKIPILLSSTIQP